MAQYDGSIRILTEISTNAAKKSLGTLSNMIVLTAKEISKLRSKMDSLKDQKVPTQEYQEIANQIKKSESELNKLLKKQEQMQSEGKNNGIAWDRLNTKIEDAKNTIKYAQGELQDLVDTGKAFVLGSDTAEYANYEKQLQNEQAALEEATKQYQAMDKLKDPYGRLSQAVNGLNEKLIKILSPIQKIRSAFAQDVKVSGYEKLQSSLGELGGIAIRAAESVKSAFSTLKQGPVAVIHGVSSSLINMANTINSAIGSVLSGGLEKFGEGIGAIAEKARQMASSVGAAIKSAASVALEKLAGLAGSALNIVLHPFQTLKNVASTTLSGVASIIKGALGSALEGLKNRAAGLGASILNGIVHPFQTLKNIAGGAVKRVNNLLSSMVSIAKKTGKAISSLASLLKRATSSMFGFGKSAKSSNNMLQGGIKNILKYGLGIRSLYALVNKLRTAIKEGFSNMAKEVDGFKNKVDSIKASTLTLKNSFAAAFRPLVEIALPYIQMVVDAMANLLDMVGQFMAAITGQKAYTKAIKQTTAAIEDENKAQNKQLSGLDKLNNLSSGSGGGADSGASTKMFEENVPISDKFAGIAQWFKDMWNDADFTELGAVLGKKLKSALESIPWNSIQQTVAKVGKSLATLINGFVEVPGLALDIGKTIGEAINTGIGGIISFLDNTKWDSVGRFIGDGANSLVDTINWVDIGHLFVEKFNAIFETAGESARTFDWKNFGLEISNGINTAISDFNWAENGAMLGDLVKGVLDSIIALLENTNWKELGIRIVDFLANVDWFGLAGRLTVGFLNLIKGVFDLLWGIGQELSGKLSEFFEEIGFNGIAGFFKGLQEELSAKWQLATQLFNDYILQPIKDFFGIHSPSTVMAEIGTYIMQGLLNGIKSLVGSVVKSIQDVWSGIKAACDGFLIFLSGVFTGNWEKAWSGVVKIFSGVRDSIRGIVNGIIGIVESMANGIISGINFVIGALNKLNFTIPATPWTSAIDIGFNIPELSNISIPRLATGAVIPANREFLAVLGDQKHGTNIEAPLATIEEAVENVLNRHGGTGGVKEITIRVPVEVDGNVLFELIRKIDLERFNSTGEPSFQI